MKIQQVNISEFKALKDVEQNIDGNNIFILGDNEVGKSSFIQFIEIALGKSTNIPDNTNGKGFVIADKDGKKIVFSVKVKDGKSVVSIESDGLKDTRKSALASLVGAMDFDIDNFVELSKTSSGRKKQVEIFKSFLPEETKSELSKFEAHIKAMYDERTDLGRNIKETTAIVNTHPLKNEIDLSVYKKVDVSELTKQKEVVKGKLNKKYLENKSVNEKLRSDFELLKDAEKDKIVQFNELQIQLISKALNANQLHAKIKELGYSGNEVGLWIKTIPASSDLKTFNIEALTQPNYIQEIPSDEEIKAIDTQIASASDANLKAIEAEDLNIQRELLKKMNEENESLTVRIDTERQMILDTIKDMNAPIEGLTFNDDQLFYNDVPVSPDSLSTSQIMELGVKLKMVENPELGILFIQRGESLGKARLDEIMQMAQKNNWQVIMEQVERGTEKIRFEIIKS